MSDLQKMNLRKFSVLLRSATLHSWSKYKILDYDDFFKNLYRNDLNEKRLHNVRYSQFSNRLRCGKIWT